MGRSLLTSWHTICGRSGLPVVGRGHFAAVVCGILTMSFALCSLLAPRCRLARTCGRCRRSRPSASCHCWPWQVGNHSAGHAAAAPCAIACSSWSSACKLGMPTATCPDSHSNALSRTSRTGCLPWKLLVSAAGMPCVMGQTCCFECQSVPVPLHRPTGMLEPLPLAPEMDICRHGNAADCLWILQVRSSKQSRPSEQSCFDMYDQ